jgi:3-deoxy-D-manno-octulosonic-acid transferase
MIRLLYSTLFALCFPFVLLKLFMRGIKAPEYKARRLERFGIFTAPNLTDSIWFHTVSVGELLAAEPIIREVQKRFPQHSVVVTTMTPTSSELLYKLFGDSVFHVYAPYDLPACVSAFLNRIKPKFLIIMETELWPNMIHKSQQRGCPVVVANARLSERSAAGYRRLSPVIGWMLDGLSLVLCQYQADADRFRSLGIAPNKIHVTGSVKYDIDVSDEAIEEGRTIRSLLPDSRRVWIAASTHDGEDEIVLSVHARLRQQYPDLVLIIVPRHPERFESAWSLSESHGFVTHRRTVEQSLQATTEVFVLDTMGEMMSFYAASDMAFVGGSFVDIGGHNPIEPAALSMPVVMGPEIYNFEAICSQLVDAGGMRIAQNEDALVEVLEGWLLQPETAKVAGDAAAIVVEKGRGAVARVISQLAPLLDRT